MCFDQNNPTNAWNKTKSKSTVEQEITRYQQGFFLYRQGRLWSKADREKQDNRKKTIWIKSVWIKTKSNRVYWLGNYTIPEVCVYFDHKLLRGNRTVKVIYQFPCLNLFQNSLYFDNREVQDKIQNSWQFLYTSARCTVWMFKSKIC